MDNVEQFVRLQTDSQQRIFSFIQTLVYHWSDAEEILQETNIILWRKREQFDLSTDFVRWANQIAYYEILKFRKKSLQKQKFSDAFLECVAQDMFEHGDSLQRQSRALEGCLKKLPQKDREVIQKRYFEGVTTQMIASLLGRPVRSVYFSLQRIRDLLHRCVLHTLAAEEQR